MQSPDLAPLPIGRIEGRVEFERALSTALDQASARGWRELIFCDNDFADWPLGDSAVVEALQRWANGQRHFTMIARDYSVLIRAHPRFVRWRQMWDHIIDCRVCRGSSSDALPSVLWAPTWVLHRLDARQGLALCDETPQRRVLLRQQLDELRHESSPGFPASILGL